MRPDLETHTLILRLTKDARQRHLQLKAPFSVVDIYSGFYYTRAITNMSVRDFKLGGGFIVSIKVLGRSRTQRIKIVRSNLTGMSKYELDVMSYEPY